MKIFREVKNKKGTIYNQTIVLNGNTLESCACTCRFMSFDFWSAKFQKSGTICRHILHVCAEEGIKLPEKYKTKRNLKIIEEYKKEMNIT